MIYSQNPRAEQGILSQICTQRLPRILVQWWKVRIFWWEGPVIMRLFLPVRIYGIWIQNREEIPLSLFQVGFSVEKHLKSTFRTPHICIASKPILTYRHWTSVTHDLGISVRRIAVRPCYYLYTLWIDWIST